jgi:hypothetical protein
MKKKVTLLTTHDTFSTHVASMHHDLCIGIGDVNESTLAHHVTILQKQARPVELAYIILTYIT